MSSQAQAAGADGQQLSWAPDVCTLPDADRPLRAAEFAGFFGTAVRGVERQDAGLLRLRLEPTAQAAERAARLAVAETGCCSFFTFTLTVAEGALSLEISAPEQHAAVLDAIAGYATAGRGDPPVA